MARPRKPENQLHSESLKLWLTDEQESILLALAAARDIPKGVVAREALLLGLRKLEASMRPRKAA